MTRFTMFVLMAVVVLLASALPANAAQTRSGWGSQHVTVPGTVHPLWAFEACAGEFMSSNVAANGFVWGGEQSCTEPSPQTLEFILENVTGRR